MMCGVDNLRPDRCSFLRWDDPTGVLSFLLSDADESLFLGILGSPVRELLIGYLAPEEGRPEIAAEHLKRAAAFFRNQLEDRRRDYARDVTSEWEAWVAGLEADAAAAA